MKWTGPVPRLARTSKQDPCQPRRRRRRGGAAICRREAGRGNDAAERLAQSGAACTKQVRDLRGAGARRRRDGAPRLVAARDVVAGKQGKTRCGRGHGMPLAWESVLAYQRGFQHERRSNSVRHRRLDHRAMAGRLFRGRPARGAAGRPRRRAGRARGQCLDPAGRRPGAGAPAGRTGAAAGGGGRRPVAPAAVWRALRGQDNIDVAGWPTTAACPRSPTRPTRMPAWCGACAPPAPS